VSPGTNVPVGTQEPPSLADPNPLACAALKAGATAAVKRALLSKALSGASPAPFGELCVPLATVDLAPDGTIGSIDAFTVRPMLYSNATLLDLILCLAARIEQCCAGATPCKQGYPAGYFPFESVTSTAGPDSSGDYVVVGKMTAASWKQFTAVISLPDSTNQVYCDTVTLTPKVSTVAYVPSAAERQGDLSKFKLPLTDPNTNQPFPGNQIPPNELPGAQTGVFAWRVRSIVPPQ
jgi:hypothetical protein